MDINTTSVCRSGHGVAGQRFSLFLFYLQNPVHCLVYIRCSVNNVKQMNELVQSGTIDQAWASCLNCDRIWAAVKNIVQTFQGKSLAASSQSDIYFSFMFVKYCSSHPWTLGYFLPLFIRPLERSWRWGLWHLVGWWRVRNGDLFPKLFPSSGMPLEPCWKRLWVGILRKSAHYWTCLIGKQSCSSAVSAIALNQKTSNAELVRQSQADLLAST